jgi:hypothetical protein
MEDVLSLKFSENIHRIYLIKIEMKDIIDTYISA